MSNSNAIRTAAHHAARRAGADIQTARQVASAVVDAIEPASGREDAAYWRRFVEPAVTAASTVTAEIVADDASEADVSDREIAAHEDESWVMGDDAGAIICIMARQHHAPLVTHAARTVVAGWMAEYRRASAA